MKLKAFILVPAVVVLGACAQTPVASAPVKAPSESPDVKTAKAPAAAAKAPAQDSRLTQQLLYEFLVGEIAGQRGDLKLSAEAYADLARKTHDVRLVRRAAQIAFYAGEMDEAAAMARLWVQLRPKSTLARQSLITSLVNLGKLDEAEPQLKALLHLQGHSVGEYFLELHGLLSQSNDPKAAMALIKHLAADYPSVPEAHLAVARSELDAGQKDEALAELDKVLSLDPDSETAALLKGELLSGKKGGDYLAFWKGFLATHPHAVRVRLAYARGLTKANQYAAARKEFETLIKDAPGSPELHLAVALLSMQMNDLDDAERNFTEALNLDYPDSGLIQMYLGELDELRGRNEKALGWYRKALAGEHADQARLKVAIVLAKLHKVDEALALLKKAENGSDAVRVVQTEVQILREAGRYQAAYDTLSEALKRMPKADDLLYDRAMIEEKLNRLPEMEADLRQLIKMQPDSAQAYNALGYTLVDRTSRVQEGITLLKKALELSPDDPFILDSMGWGQYKAGHMKEALEYLRRAYHGRADPEIAAHLGEVLWRHGDTKEAKRIWREAVKAHPDNALLRSTLSRFGQ